MEVDLKVEFSYAVINDSRQSLPDLIFENFYNHEQMLNLVKFLFFIIRFVLRGVNMV